MVISASADKTIRLWSIYSERKQVKLEFHKESVTGVSMHPLGDYLLSCSEDKQWVFSDMKTGTVLQSQMVWSSSDNRHQVTGSCSLASSFILKQRSSPRVAWTQWSKSGTCAPRKIQPTSMGTPDPLTRSRFPRTAIIWPAQLRTLSSCGIYACLQNYPRLQNNYRPSELPN